MILRKNPDARMKILVCSVRRSIRRRLFRKISLALRVALWIFGLPIALRIYSIPQLLERFTRAATSGRKAPDLDVSEAAGIVMRTCSLQLFNNRVFPQACLRQSLTLYRMLTLMGCPVAIHFGVSKAGNDLLGHSWVTIAGEPLTDRTANQLYRPIYSYPSVSSIFPRTSEAPQAFVPAKGASNGREKTPSLTTS
jgi:hypothetical protein